MNVKCAFVFRTPKVMIILLSQLHSACLSDISTEFPQGKLRFLSLSCHFVFFNICLTRSRLVHELALTYFALAHCIAQLFGEKFRGHNHNVHPLPQLLPDLGNNLGQSRVLLGVAKCAAGLHKYFLSNAANCISTSCNTLQSFSLYADKSFYI